MRPVSLRLVPALALAATLAAPVTAFAQEEEEPYPIVYGQRPITLNAETYAAQAVFTFAQPGPDLDMIIGLDAGFDYGIMKNLTAGVNAAFSLSPEGEVSNPSIYGLYRFLRGATPVELGALLTATFPVEDGTDFQLGLGIVGNWQINDAAQLKYGVVLDLVFADEVVTNLGIPLSLAISFTRNIFFELETGMYMLDVDPDLLSIPLGVKLGYTLPKSDDEPLADLFVGFAFPGFVSSSVTFDLGTGESSSEKDINTDAWTIMVGGRVYLP